MGSKKTVYEWALQLLQWLVKLFHAILTWNYGIAIRSSCMPNLHCSLQLEVKVKNVLGNQLRALSRFPVIMPWNSTCSIVGICMDHCAIQFINCKRYDNELSSKSFVNARLLRYRIILGSVIRLDSLLALRVYVLKYLQNW